MPNDNVLTDDHAFQLYLLARRTSDWARWINELRASIAAHPGQPEPKEPPSPDDIQGWAVTVEVNGVGILTISDNCVSGIDNIADFDGIVRNCAHHLIGFIGQPEPRAEVTKASRPIPRHWNPVYNTDPVQRACTELPDGYEIEIMLERDAGTVDVCGPDGGRLDVDFDEDTFDWKIHAAIDAAIDAARTGASS
ncbi:hypothetical protein [Burkholderia cenocepacia]|uniref:hypothetical protein n=1 Tax=Burkholderia cenocepacia TaxID=95486 RepID=UPI001B904554|nr:hypothetical protein [Burkholderia cenocepacia]MBR8475791.1 hypothetical protein [Burkholderia cenocepacia]